MPRGRHSAGHSRVPGSLAVLPLKGLDALISEGVDAGVFPGAVVHVRREGTVLLERAYGRSAVLPEPRPMRSDLIFDLASLTKPIATATAVLQLWERGEVDIDRPVEEYLPGFGARGKETVTLRHLLAHTAGLPAWIRLYLKTRSESEALRYICDLEPVRPPGAGVEYSDLGFIVLGEVVRRVSGSRLDAYVDRHIAPVLGWQWTRFNPPAEWTSRCVPTEVGNGYERAASGSEGDGFRWRSGVIVGEVHDGNAFYTFGGVAGHAGLFSVADEVGRFGAAVLALGEADHGRLLAEETVREATRDQTGKATGRRGLGWAFASATPVSFGRRASREAFGHTGFTGTSILIDPPRRLVAILLTNRVHPRASKGTERINEFRGAFHDLVVDALA
jgi:CubicO group peptidase (beta-lactamase class C family)